MARGYLKDKEYRLIDITTYIRQRMRIMKVNQTDLADELGITQSAVSQKLDTGNFNIPELLIILNFLKADSEKIGKLLIL